MFLNSRRFIVWLSSLLAVLLVYLVYTRLAPSSFVDGEGGAGVGELGGDSNVGDANGPVGKIDGVGIGGMKQVRLVKLDAQKQVERVVGFEEVLHKSGDEWVLEEPFMDLYRPKFTARVTADTGTVQVETAAGKTTPKDVSLAGNVVIRIFGKDSNDVNEAILYLDDVSFQGERTAFSTAGFVEYVSSRARLVGRGMEVVYDEGLQRVDYLRIGEVESLRFRVLSSPSVLGAGGVAARQGGAEGVIGAAGAAGSGAGGAYRCVLKGNVVVSSVEQVVLADVVSVTGVLGPGGSIDESQAEDKSEAGTDEVAAESDEAAGGGEEIVVRCDGGVVIAPQARENVFEDFIGAEGERKGSGRFDAGGVDAADTEGKSVLTARRIDYDAVSGEAVAPGGCEIKFFAGDVIDANEGVVQVPVVMSCKREGVFRTRTNEIRFAGDCRCRMVRRDGDMEQEYVLLSPEVLVEPAEKKGGQAGGVIARVGHITASGGEVTVESVRKLSGSVLGGVQLKCEQIDYDAGRREFVARRPRRVYVDNSKVAEPNEETGRFSLRRRSHVYIYDFEELRYALDAKTVVADGGEGSVLLNYFPIVEGQIGDKVEVSAGRIEAELDERKGGRTELARLAASGGVTYEDGDKEFVGSEFSYDVRDGVVKVWGDEFDRCIFNGVFVDGLEWDLSSDKVKVNVTGPGAVRVK